MFSSVNSYAFLQYMALLSAMEKEVIHDYLVGVPIRKIARQHDISKYKVVVILKKEGVWDGGKP